MIKIESYKKTKETSTKSSGGFANVTYANSSSSGGGTLDKHSLWGQPFDGTQDVNGTITTSGNVYSNDTVSGQTGLFPNLSSHTVTTTNVMATDGNITNLTSTTANVDNITSKQVSTTNLSAQTIEGNTADIQNITSDTIVVNSLEVLKAAHFNSLTIDEIKAVGGRVIITVADAELLEVEDNGTSWRCYFLATDDTDSRYQTFAKDDLVVCQTFNAASGTSYNVSNTYYWRKIDNVSTTPIQRGNNMCHYVDISQNDFDLASISKPSKGDKIVQLGNKSDTSRQSAIIISAYNSTYLDPQVQAPSIIQYDGIDDYELASHRKNVISKELNEFHGHFKISSGADIEDLIKSQTTYRIEPYVEQYYLNGNVETLYNNIELQYAVIKTTDGVDEDITESCSGEYYYSYNKKNVMDLETVGGYLVKSISKIENSASTDTNIYCVVTFYNEYGDVIGQRIVQRTLAQSIGDTYEITPMTEQCYADKDKTTITFNYTYYVYRHNGNTKTLVQLDKSGSTYGGYSLKYNFATQQYEQYLDVNTQGMANGTVTVPYNSNITACYIKLYYKDRDSGNVMIIQRAVPVILKPSATFEITDEIKGTVSGYKTDLDGLSSTTTNFITTTEQTLSSITSTVEGQTTTINNLSGDVTTVKNDMSEVKQTQSSITSTVTSMQDEWFADNILRGYATSEGWTTFDDFQKQNYGFYFYDNTWCYAPPCPNLYGTYTLSFGHAEGNDVTVEIYGSTKEFDESKTYVDYMDDAAMIASVSTSAYTTSEETSWNALAYDDKNKRFHVTFNATASTMILRFKGNGECSSIVLEYGIHHHKINVSNAFNQSEIIQKSDEIKLSVTNVENGLKETGIDIQNGLISITADNTQINGNLNLYAQNDVDALTLYDSNGIGRTTLTSNEVGYLSAQTMDNSSEGYSQLLTLRGYTTKVCINDNLVVQSGTTVSGGTQWNTRILNMYMFYRDSSGTPHMRTTMKNHYADLIFEPKTDSSLTTYTMSGTRVNENTYVALVKSTSSKITFAKNGTYRVYIGLRNASGNYIDDVSDSVTTPQYFAYSYNFSVKTDDSKAIYATDGIYIAHKENDYLFYGKDGLACAYNNPSGTTSTHINPNGIASFGARNAYINQSTGYPTDWRLYWGGKTGPSHLALFKSYNSTASYWTNSQTYGNIQTVTPWTASTSTSVNKEIIYGSTDIILVDYLIASSTDYYVTLDLQYAEYEGHIVEVRNIGTNSNTTLYSGSGARFLTLGARHDNISSTYGGYWQTIRLVFRNITYSPSSGSSYNGQWIVLSLT